LGVNQVDVESFKDGVVVLGDSTTPEVIDDVWNRVQLPDRVPLVIADPPYGNIVSNRWDKIKTTDVEFVDWMLCWTRLWQTRLVPGGAFYVWGGIGKPGFRPFFRYVAEVESAGRFELANLITWKKRRGYGVQNNYLFTREECAYFVNGSAKRPATFNVPYLNELRGYAGFNKKYPAKSPLYRRSNVWTDINEMMQGKVHPTQKTQRLHEVMIEVHTQPGDVVIDLFAGAGTTAMAARKLGRRFVVFDNDPISFSTSVNRLKGSET